MNQYVYAATAIANSWDEQVDLNRRGERGRTDFSDFRVEVGEVWSADGWVLRKGTCLGLERNPWV